MIEYTDDDLLDFVFDLCPAEKKKEIEERSRADPELANQIALVRAISSYSSPTPVKKRLWQKLAFLFTRRGAVIAVGVLFLLTGAAWATWYIVVGPSLMHDNFNDDVFDSSKWHSARPRLRVLDGYLRLMNRGSVVTQKEFTDPIEVSFDWKWIDHAEFPHYSEDLCVVLRTTGKHREKHAFEITDGVVIRFITYENRLSVESPPLKVTAKTEKQGLLMPSVEQHHIRITDDGESIAVYMTGPKIDKKYDKEPVIRVKCQEKAEAYHIAIYNRELLSGATHESRIDNFTVRRMK